MTFQTRIHQEGDTTVFESVQDCTPIAEHTRALHKEGFHGSKDMKHAASLPMVLVERYCNDRGIDFAEWMRDPTHIRTMLSDPALAAFRVWEGRV